MKILFILLTLSSSRNLAFGFKSRSSDPFRWLLTKRLCFASTGFSPIISGSIINTILDSDDEVKGVGCACPFTGGVGTTGKRYSYKKK